MRRRESAHAPRLFRPRLAGDPLGGEIELVHVGSERPHLVPMMKRSRGFPLKAWTRTFLRKRAAVVGGGAMKLTPAVRSPRAGPVSPWLRPGFPYSLPNGRPRRSLTTDNFSPVLPSSPVIFTLSNSDFQLEPLSSDY